MVSPTPQSKYIVVRPRLQLLEDSQQMRARKKHGDGFRKMLAVQQWPEPKKFANNEPNV